MILVTGDSGFIGRHLIRRLVRRGVSLRGIDLHSKPGNSPSYLQVAGSITDRNAVMRAMRGVQCVIHLAAEHRDFGIPNEKYFEVNEAGTKQLLRCASELDLKRFIFYSSVAVYGTGGPSEEDAVAEPSTPYGASKLAGELAVRAWAGEDPTRKAVIIRPTVVFGPFSRANIRKLIAYVCDRKFIWVGSGEQVKSIAYVENLVAATEFLLDDMRPGVEVFNYSDEPQMTTRQLVSLIAQKSGVAEPRWEIPLGVALQVAKVFDIVGALTNTDLPVTTARLRKFTTSTLYRSEAIRRRGFIPPYTIAEGLEQTIKWYREDVKTGKPLQLESAGE
jgi:nucleoside-diphosphate-sugar epimerase